MTTEQLVGLLTDTPEKELQGLVLLRQHQPPPGQLLPRGLDREVYVEAVLEMIDYTEACEKLAERIIANTPAIPITTAPVEEFVL